MSDKQQAKKRKKQFYMQSAKKGRWAHALEADMRGFLITCNNREREAVREAYNVLNEHADKLYGPEQKAEKQEAKSSDEEDIEAALAKEVSDLKTQKKSERRFQQVESGANNCIFIKTTLPNPTELVDSIFSDVYESETAKSRYIMRLMPVIGTSKCNEEKIKKMAEETLAAHFTDSVGHSFIVNVKVRNNNAMNRKTLIPLLVDVVKELNPANNPDLDNPEYVVNLDIIRAMLCLSVLKNFTKFRKYNLQEVAGAKTAAAKASAQAAEKATAETTVQATAETTVQATVQATAETTVQATAETTAVNDDAKEELKEVAMCKTETTDPESQANATQLGEESEKNTDVKAENVSEGNGENKESLAEETKGAVKDVNGDSVTDRKDAGGLEVEKQNDVP